MREAVLAVLDQGEAFGLEVIERANKIPGAPRLHQGNTYHVLRELEREGVLVVREVDGPPERGGRPRFYYRKAS